ncbi:hypothetical protein BBF96_11375 [Anoxybacter fermentans]|uniref:YqgF/RNase H-like domain-containing protein n=1 Tax=Anoxybacter fermentans TaxID=1323375 RepID=A0A3Q9HRD4_9FIRM|nr:Holliday junction resolvase RuvX [Anoxybacter fermentans]AZR73939.1 hypothetical protein BBF96_11375 [Anoxybacter fermentans]
MILSIDPGREKTGVAIYDPLTRAVIYHDIVPTRNFAKRFIEWEEKYSLKTLLLGDGTFSKSFQAELKKMGFDYKIVLVDEAYSTLEARKIYFDLNPPRGWRKLIPLSLQTPSKPIDDLVAIVLLKRYLGEMPQIGK